MRACAEPAAERPSTWITADFERSYSELHRRGLAHSVEVWEGDDLVGRALRRHAGRLLRRRVDVSPRDRRVEGGGRLPDRAPARGRLLAVDAQVPTPHLARLGAVTIPRADYLARLRRALAATAQTHVCLTGPDGGGACGDADAVAPAALRRVERLVGARDEIDRRRDREHRARTRRPR